MLNLRRSLLLTAMLAAIGLTAGLAGCGKEEPKPAAKPADAPKAAEAPKAAPKPEPLKIASFLEKF